MEATGSDVPDLPPLTDEERREHSELSEKLRLLFQGCSEFRPNEMTVHWGLFAHKVNKMIQARVQAAAVEARERCAKVSDDEYALDLNTPCDEGHREFRKKYSTVEVSEAIRALPLPTSALAAALLRARISQLDRINFIQYDLGEAFADWVERERADLERQLAALTPPAPEKGR